MFCVLLGLVFNIWIKSSVNIFTFFQIIFMNCLVNSLPWLLIVFISFHKDNNMLVVYIKFPLFSQKNWRESTNFFIFTCSSGLFISLNSFGLINLPASIGLIFKWPNQLHVLWMYFKNNVCKDTQKGFFFAL